VQNYVQAWTENSFSHYFLNSLIVAFATVVITVVFASLAAFAFRAVPVSIEAGRSSISSLAESRRSQPAVVDPTVPVDGSASLARFVDRSCAVVRRVQLAPDFPLAGFFRRSPKEYRSRPT